MTSQKPDDPARPSPVPEASAADTAAKDADLRGGHLRPKGAPPLASPDRGTREDQTFGVDARNPAVQAEGSEEGAAGVAREAAGAGVPSSLDLDSRASAARTGRAELQQRFREHNEADPGITGGDVDADWGSAYAVGDEAPGGDNPTPDQAVVEDVGRALGVEYHDEEELKGVDKIQDRDRHRWELDPASSEDYQERNRDKGGQ